MSVRTKMASQMYNVVQVEHGPFGGIDTSTVLMLHGDGANLSTNILDASYSDHTQTVTGTATISTGQSKFGGASISFGGGAGNFVNSDGGNDFAFGTGDWTIDFWARFGVVGACYLMDFRGVAGDLPRVTILMPVNTIALFVNGANRIVGTTVISALTWYHIAVVRSGTVTWMFLNGVQESAPWIDTTNYTASAGGRPIIGSDVAVTSGFNGFLDEIRISKGVARWVLNFAPPTIAYF